jgi:arsenate reductase
MPTPLAKDPYDELVNDLAYFCEGVFSRETVAAAVAEARELIEPRAKARASLPVLVARQAREQLMSAARAEGRIAKRVPELEVVRDDIQARVTVLLRDILDRPPRRTT